MPTGLNDGKNDSEENMMPVTLPSGASFYVHEREYQYFVDRARRYQSDNDFQNISDFQDLDRLLMLELLCQRWATWVSQQRDYWGDAVDENTLQKSLKEHSGEIRQLKKTLSIDREAREKLRGEDSVENFLAQLRHRAKNFGYTRDKQTAKAIELFHELKSIVILHLNCDDTERVHQKCTVNDIMTWLTETAFPEFDEIDAHFRETNQKMWIRSQ